ncbi:polyphosphate kinase 1 [Spirosoma sp. HMF4905]|uniref:Polyphosphate kinase n=1 Tax=Spirosoma arboris TaxID=2682092 RepID=A0A7K1SD46_9BACT|nr:polyphosphate kinase 1 [Spirosoma arboris]MVM31486.1 polyphosphate kinase 1 [Spirosoma arboris]
MALFATPVYFDRDLSWLSFNERILQEAANPAVPLYERIRFLAIFSSNLDEFSRVRVPALLAIHAPGESYEEIADSTRWQAVQDTLQRQLTMFGQVLTGQLLPLLDQHKIHVYYREELPDSYHSVLSEYFYSRVLAFLQPVWLTNDPGKTLFLEDSASYFVVALEKNHQPGVTQYVLLNIPRGQLPRFLVLSPTDDRQAIVFLDDIIRQQLSIVFPDCFIQGSYSFKINRDADSSIHDEEVGEIDQKVANMIDMRERGLPSRFLFDATMPVELRNFLANYFALSDQEMIEGGRYHNLRDLDQLPNPSGLSLTFPPQPPSPHRALQGDKSIFDRLAQKDYLLHFPYQSYNHILRFFNEAAIDPYVSEIYVSLYRVASDSFIVNALMSAARNGKKVTVFVELKARFDEANNLKWAKRMKAAGIHLIYSIPSLKVHAKTALIKRKSGLTIQHYGLVATGNFNESTARFYTDHVLLTSHSGITQELDLLFAYLRNRELPTNYPFLSFQHLLVSQFNLMDRFLALIDREIAHKQAGHPARIVIKLNNLQEKTMIDKLYEASRAGVPIDLIVRSICCLVPGVPGLSETITVRRIVDRYLEHGRVFIFHNNGQREIYLGSADWMNRNLHHRIEVCCPIYDPVLQDEMQAIIDLQLADNQQARLIDSNLEMIPVPDQSKQLRSQQAIYTWLAERSVG